MTNEELHQRAISNPASITMKDIDELARQDTVVNFFLNRYKQGLIYVGSESLTLAQTLMACVCVLSVRLASTNEILNDYIAESQRSAFADFPSSAQE